MCDSTKKTPEIKSLVETNACSPVVTMATSEGCADFSATSWVRFLGEHPYILGSILVVLGAIVTFFGRKFFPWTVAGIGAVTGFGITMLLFSLFGMLEGLN